MRFAAPDRFEGLVLEGELAAAGFAEPHVVYFEGGDLDITATVDGVQIGEEDRAAVESVLAVHNPPPPAGPLPDPVPKLAAEFERVLDLLVEKKVLTPADRQKVKGPR